MIHISKILSKKRVSKKCISKKDIEGYFSKLDPSKLEIAHDSGLVLKRDILNVKQTETIANLRTQLLLLRHLLIMVDQ
jgi:hypothetical protein